MPELHSSGHRRQSSPAWRGQSHLDGLCLQRLSRLVQTMTVHGAKSLPSLHKQQWWDRSHSENSLTHKHSLLYMRSLILSVPPSHLPSLPHPSGLTSHFLRTACPAPPNQVRLPGDRFIVPCTVLERTDHSSFSKQGTWHKAVGTKMHPRNICWINKCEFIILPNFTKKQLFKN